MTCTKCNGTGEEPLDERYVQTLKRIPKAGITAMALSEIHKDANPAAYSQRLKRLMVWGHLTRRPHGKFWIYSLATKTPIPKTKSKK